MLGGGMQGQHIRPVRADSFKLLNMAEEEEMELPSPSRRILTEMNPLFYPFGNTPARNLLEGHQVDHPYKV